MTRGRTGSRQVKRWSAMPGGAIFLCAIHRSSNGLPYLALMGTMRCETWKTWSETLKLLEIRSLGAGIIPVLPVNWCISYKAKSRTSGVQRPNYSATRVQPSGCEPG